MKKEKERKQNNKVRLDIALYIIFIVEGGGGRLLKMYTKNPAFNMLEIF